ncbi:MULTISPECIES: rhomboid family intramembrane serine protease [Oleiagrimonas]|jgi:membrane associated rhomboid family serine protease|uniref:Rhomboid family intramembrane serine protease n=1 Tax=Oleiagrimonas citrea TaxID=1665687 RepID=A0A846ZP68_9GAMM|nr:MULTISPECIES: rhomboid family intramembrane serine protease [Oleiagrimonas]NKZ39241.1 rhomboid family intramembrane serine protease [Oleiagrimonas citrea]RAP57830.1 rhomboid family intramembrane serine protease [Oleiagrimonas sp. MCCC 1A03011]
MIVTVLLIVATCVVSFYAFKRQGLAMELAMWPPGVRGKRQYWRFLTYGFVHADMQHLLFNMITLFFFGRAVEILLGSYIGPFGFALFYLSALVLAILPSYQQHRNDPRYISIGASGAVSAVLFSFILFQPWSMILVFFFPIPAIVYAVLYVGFTIYMDRRGGDNVNHSAHLWGAAYGVLVTLAVAPNVLDTFLAQLFHPHFGI